MFLITRYLNIISPHKTKCCKTLLQTLIFKGIIDYRAFHSGHAKINEHSSAPACFVSNLQRLGRRNILSWPWLFSQSFSQWCSFSPSKIETFTLILNILARAVGIAFDSKGRLLATIFTTLSSMYEVKFVGSYLLGDNLSCDFFQAKFARFLDLTIFSSPLLS